MLSLDRLDSLARRLSMRQQDAVLAALMATLSLAATWLVPVFARTRTDTALSLLVALGMTLPLAWRTRNIAVAYGVSWCALMATAYPRLDSSYAIIATLILLYSACAVGSARLRAIALVTTAVAAATFSVIGIRSGASIPDTTLAIVAMAGLPIAFATGTRQRANAVANERILEARQAATDERLRIARELHDVLGHRLGGIAVQAAGGERLLATHPDRAAQALATIHAESHAALEEVRGVLGAMRHDVPADLRRPPCLARVDELVRHAVTSGATISIVRHQMPPLPDATERAAFRIIQEALANVVRHARPAEATLTITIESSSLRITVRDAGRRPTGATEGHGLIGMRERVRAHGGSLRAGPAPDGGWHVEATLPLVAA